MQRGKSWDTAAEWHCTVFTKYSFASGFTKIFFTCKINQTGKLQEVVQLSKNGSSSDIITKIYDLKLVFGKTTN